MLEHTTHHGPFTWADLDGIPDDGVRREIIGGTLIVSPSPSIRHQRASLRLAVILDRATSTALEVLTAPCDYRYDVDNYVEPDLLVVRAADFDLDDVLRAPAVPLLLVEVLSPSNRTYDTLLKRDLYERLGVPSYWIVHPGGADQEPSITALRLVDGAYEVEAEVSGAERFATDRPFPVTFTPADLLA